MYLLNSTNVSLAFAERCGEKCFYHRCHRFPTRNTSTDTEDVGIIMISQNIAEQIRNLIAEHNEVIPTIMEIPSKDVSYDPEKDTILCRAARNLYGNEVGMQKLKQLD